ncbi:universal stress protein [Rubrobacter taiwanensis]|uniref:Universal stress protein n=1 Tax=Rubrobacter taiwanensis TaxID=185139 RepID=A0A4R1BSD3_9ACTN|nr:universal stress protein [Rubrobacter taiwanensis]TCJ20739.1 universal stress protein [Rubrobacter taiwanensis]
MSIFPTKILLATDGSRDAELAAATAVDLAGKTGSELHVVFVLRTREAFEYDAMGFTIEESHEEVKQEGQRLLDEQVRKVEEIGGTVAGTHFRMGRPDEKIVAVAEEIGAGLIVMGSRGLGGIRRALMGSVSDSVVRHAHCPVLIIRPEKDAGSRGHFWRKEPSERAESSR